MSNQNTSSVIFVCWGNICRSPMAEFVARKVFANEGLDARITSAGVSDEEHGGPMDSRARSALKSHGYPCSGHNAHQIDGSEIMSADLVIAAEPRHIQMKEGLLVRSRRRWSTKKCLKGCLKGKRQACRGFLLAS